MLSHRQDTSRSTRLHTASHAVPPSPSSAMMQRLCFDHADLSLSGNIAQTTNTTTIACRPPNT